MNMKKTGKFGIAILLGISLMGGFTPVAHAKTTYYGNGVSCDSKTKKCSVNWGQTIKCIANISVASLAGATIGKC
ncbi:MAG: leucocin A/sakacin P family class II bacteriocin [Aerococcus sp.]|nr:leucocin A/sakacin P family class II bacteriocin [Aerococcus sp.]